MGRRPIWRSSILVGRSIADLLAATVSMFFGSLLIALTAFMVLTLPAIKASNFHPFTPTGFGNLTSGTGYVGAAASISRHAAGAKPCTLTCPIPARTSRNVGRPTRAVIHGATS